MDKFFKNSLVNILYMIHQHINTYPILKSIVGYLDDIDVETLSCVNKTLREEILIFWKNRIKCGGLMRSISYHVMLSKEYKVVNGRPYFIPYKRYHELFGNSFSSNDGLVRVNILIFLTKEVDIHEDKKLIVLSPGQDIRPFMDVRKGYRYGVICDTVFVHGLQIRTLLSYQDLIILTLNESDVCLFLYDNCKRPMLQFVFTYNKYMKLLKNIIALNNVDIHGNTMDKI